MLILISNLMGMLPSIVAIPPTANLNTTLALALCSFLYYNWIGIRENGLVGHIKHFFGPVLFIAPLMFPIEIISNLARILSLSLRLFGNIFGEEQVSGVIGGLTPWIIPIFLMPLGLLTAFLQTFIFVTLSMIYLGEVTHHDESHGHGAHEKAAEAH
jgi:F-type H+-transporting ATPase subunit a